MRKMWSRSAALGCAALVAGACQTMDPAMAGAGQPAPAGMMAQPDAQMQAVLDQLAALGARPVEQLTPQQARTQPSPADAVKALLQRSGRSTAPEPVGNVQDRTIPGPGGAAIPVRIYTPAGTGPFPVIVYYHGGGWVIATIDTYDSSARALTNAARAIVVSVEYRKGPENRFPAAHDDAFAAYQWVVNNTASIGGNPMKIAVAGESAGGGLAVQTAMLARDRNVRAPVHVLAVYPIADGDTESPSYTENAMAKPLSRAGMQWFFQHYPRTPADLRDPRISLTRANLRGLPPTTIVNAQIDPLRSDGEELAAALRSAGVTVQQRTWPAVTHEFFGMCAVVTKACEAVQFGAAGLRGGFGM
ncbi:alpha/beta hydrolase [Longimicrobium terrae]|uniref:Acetyl esterase/lipase n=1 Tax=Longimicrobium terrae TaxID=1639882 RepID=A0A841GP96_9BACT|nr:alpha/beta hydrolase [Longimicrobium terrae]MBB4634767.1 acetyl esterase/lipase [Longimicrobium terrae]MBB6069162.1 acetyl esterase/lipase [Longimicrobium terrae]